VLGYSQGRTSELHPICAARLARAADLAGPADVVLLSGWARRGSASSEAELMRKAWRGASGSVVSDPRARTTAENAFAVAALARAHDVREVVVVTSAWHAPRARYIFRSAFRGSDTRVEVVAASDGRRLGARLGELWRWPGVPLAVVLARRGRGV
jgi:uncharacterized SAM-binding protein YcdF (DUF218 family)